MPAVSLKGVKEQITTSVDITDTGSVGEAIDARNFNLYSLQVIHAGVTGAALVDVQGSIDKTNWTTIGTGVTTSGAAGSAIARQGTAYFADPWIRWKVNTAAVAGSATIGLALKS